MGAASSPGTAAEGPALTRPDAASAASRLGSCETATRAPSDMCLPLARSLATAIGSTQILRPSLMQIS